MPVYAKKYALGIRFFQIYNPQSHSRNPDSRRRHHQKRWDGRFEDENFKIKHGHFGAFSMVNSGPNTNGSQLLIALIPAEWFDGKHVVFGRVIDGFQALQEIERRGSKDGKTTLTLTIIGCGECPSKF